MESMLERLGVYAVLICMIIGLFGIGSPYAKNINNTFEKIEIALASVE